MLFIFLENNFKYFPPCSNTRNFQGWRSAPHITHNGNLVNLPWIRWNMEKPVRFLLQCHNVLSGCLQWLFKIIFANSSFSFVFLIFLVLWMFSIWSITLLMWDFRIQAKNINSTLNSIFQVVIKISKKVYNVAFSLILKWKNVFHILTSSRNKSCTSKTHHNRQTLASTFQNYGVIIFQRK